MAHGIKEDRVSWMAKSGSLVSASGDNGATGSNSKTDKPYIVTSVSYRLVCQNADGIPRAMSMYANVNGINIAQWSGSQSSTKTLQGTWSGRIEAFNGVNISCQAVSESNQSHAEMNVIGWEELM